MSALATILLGRGAAIAGSDRSESETSQRLRILGARVEIGHRRENVGDVDLVVTTDALAPDNPEVLAAQERGIPLIQGSEMLGRLMAEFKHRIGIAGTHGKTSTTSMTSLVLMEAGLDPTIVIGGDVEALGGNSRLGAGDVFLTEACEAFSSFLHLHPSVAVITNIDADHMEHFKTLDNVKQTFARFLSQVDKNGCVIACIDDEFGGVSLVRDGLSPAGVRLLTYGQSAEARLRAIDIDIKSPAASFDVLLDGKPLGRISLAVAGMHNVRNALAATAVGLEHGADFKTIHNALAKHKGAGRRFELLGEVAGIMVVDDYAHHPTEILATITAARSGWRRRLIVVFQPHLYTRTLTHLKEFASALSLADQVIVTDIYAAREEPIPGVSAEAVALMINQSGGAAEYIADKDTVAGRLLPDLRENDMVIVMGAGDIRPTGEALVDLLKAWAEVATR